MAVYYSFYGILGTAVVIQNYEIQHLNTKVCDLSQAPELSWTNTLDLWRHAN